MKEETVKREAAEETQASEEEERVGFYKAYLRFTEDAIDIHSIQSNLAEPIADRVTQALTDALIIHSSNSGTPLHEVKK